MTGHRWHGVNVQNSVHDMSRRKSGQDATLTVVVCISSSISQVQKDGYTSFDGEVVSPRWASDHILPLP